VIRIKDREEFYREYYLYLLLIDETNSEIINKFPTPEEQAEYFAMHFSVESVNPDRIIIPESYIEFYIENMLCGDGDFATVEKEMRERVFLYPYIYEPQKFDWQVAIQLGMVPVVIYLSDTYLFLISPGTDKDVTFILDTYQLLVDDTLPEDSPLLYVDEVPLRLPNEIREKLETIFQV